ncbi:MAG: aspartate/glutamate racemase family protein [Aquabacterium sp.]
MSHVLLINPNTRQALTAELLAQLQAQGLGQGATKLMGATAPFGADYIASESSYVVAAHAVRDAWQRHVLEHGRPKAVLVACFGDPGVWAVREASGLPVMGLAEAAMREADALGPFAIVTGGSAWGPMLERLARGMQLGGPARLRWVRAVEASGGELAADPDAGAAALAQACHQVLQDDVGYLFNSADVAGGGARAMASVASIILGGAALGGWAERLQPAPACPVIDSVAAGARWLRAWA